MYDDKKAIYQANITRALAEMYQHMENMLDHIPEGIDECDLTPEHEDIINRIEAIEQEWIVDPEQREALSLINWQ